MFFSLRKRQRKKRGVAPCASAYGALYISPPNKRRAPRERTCEAFRLLGGRELPATEEAPQAVTSTGPGSDR